MTDAQAKMIFDGSEDAVKCFLDPLPRPERSYKIESVRPPFHLSVSFLGFLSLVFSEIRMVLGAHI